jgi:hypothetical protein
LEALRASTTAATTTAEVAWIDEVIVETREKSGCGLLLEDEPVSDHVIEGRNQSTRVILLTDTFTEKRCRDLYPNGATLSSIEKESRHHNLSTHPSSTSS